MRRAPPLLLLLPPPAWVLPCGVSGMGEELSSLERDVHAREPGLIRCVEVFGWRSCGMDTRMLLRLDDLLYRVSGPCITGDKHSGASSGSEVLTWHDCTLARAQGGDKLSGGASKGSEVLTWHDNTLGRAQGEDEVLPGQVGEWRRPRGAAAMAPGSELASRRKQCAAVEARQGQGQGVRVRV